VHEHVGAFEHGFQVAARDVHEVDVRAPNPAGGLAHVEGDHLVIRGETGQEPLGDEPGGPRNGNRGHVHRLTNVVHPAQGDDDGEEQDFPGLPPGAGFSGLPGFGPGGIDLTQLMGMLSSPGPVNWEVARQIARSVALDGGAERPPDPAAPAEFAELARAAQTHVADLTGLAASLGTQVRVLGASEWAELHIGALRPVLEALASTLGNAFQSQIQAGIDTGEIGPGDPLTGLLPMLAPVLLGLQAGAMIGYLAHHALGRYDLPLPTADTPNLCFVARHIDDFESAWSLPRADLRFYLAVHEVVHAATRSVPWVRERLVRLSTEYVSAYNLDPSLLESRLGSLDPADPQAFETLAAQPEELLGALRTPAQDAIQTRLRVFTTVLEGYADTILEQVAQRLVPSYAQIHEAMQRHRIERGEAGQFIESLLGLDLGRDDYARGSAFCQGVIERAGLDELNRVWADESMIPTPSELDAPGLWLARIDLPEAKD
jgi:putative hydrolase